ncbi:MAG: hypothetical protein L3J53_06590 [Proteobacteria bacterium]|nr:hypothetical protein [Pseudomonadota bacterium]
MSNNLDNQISHLNVIPRKLLNLFSRAIAKLLLKFNVDKNEYSYCLNEQLILEAQRQFPKATRVELSARTGIDRRFISGYLDGEMPRVKSNKLTLILSDLKWTINKYHAGSNKLPKTGPFRSFESICGQWASGTLTYKAVLAELVRIGSIIDHGDKVELVVAKESDVNEKVQYFDIFSTLLNRFANTVVLNLKDSDSEEKNYQIGFNPWVNPVKNIPLDVRHENIRLTYSPFSVVIRIALVAYIIYLIFGE